VCHGASLGGHRKLRHYRTVQPVASFCTDCAVQARSLHWGTVVLQAWRDGGNRRRSSGTENKNINLLAPE